MRREFNSKNRENRALLATGLGILALWLVLVWSIALVPFDTTTTAVLYLCLLAALAIQHKALPASTHYLGASDSSFGWSILLFPLTVVIVAPFIGLTIMMQSAGRGR